MSDLGSDDQLMLVGDMAGSKREVRRRAIFSALEDWRTTHSVPADDPGEDYPDPDETPPGDGPDFDPLPPTG